MVKVDVASAYRVVSPKGAVYWYAWKGRGAPRLHGEPGSAAWLEQLQAAIDARDGRDDARMSGLVVAYRASDDWSDLAPKTRKEWSRWLDRIAITFGPLRIAQFGRPEIREDIERWRNRWKDKPRSADMAMQVLSRLLTFAVRKGKIPANPCVAIPKIYSADRSAIIWTDDEIDKLLSVCSTEMSWAVRLALATGLRQGDLLRLGWSHVGSLAIEVRTRKSGGKTTALIPMHAELRTLLDEIPKRSTVVLTSGTGGPWLTGFTSSWRKTVARSKIDGKRFHDFRGTFATKMFVAGFSLREIAGMLAWSEDFVEAIIDRYVRRDAILLDRIRRMDEATKAGPEKSQKKVAGPAPGDDA